MSLEPTSRVVVIGGTSGIGLAVAAAARKAGAQVVVGSRSPESVQRSLAQLPGAAGQPVDVTSPASLQSFFDSVGEFDHLVYTAGDAIAGGLIADYSPAEAQRFFDVRLFRALDTVRVALRTLRLTGSITLTAGSVAYRGGPGTLLGAAMSGAVIAAARSLATELAPRRVNVVALGIVRTPLWSGMTEATRESVFASAANNTLVGRIAEPEEVAKSFIHLMDEDYVTGTVSLVDGGGVLH